MSLQIKIQAKAEQVLTSEASFFGVNPTALAKAIIDKVTGAGMVRDVLQGVDVASYETRHRDRSISPDTYRFRGVSRTLKEIQALTGISSVLIKSRLDRGWKLERAATTPPNFKSRAKREDAE